MQPCPKTNLTCASCSGKCLLEERKKHADPYCRENNLSTCNDELKRLDMLNNYVPLGSAN